MAPLRAPSRRRFSGFVHLLARFYQNYDKAVEQAARRKRSRAVDIDVQPLKDGTPVGAHWPTVGKNKLHDPRGLIRGIRRLDSLTLVEFLRLRGPKGEKTHSLAYYLVKAAKANVRVEVEAKSTIPEAQWRKLLKNQHIAAMNRKGLLQVKTLAFMGAPTGAINRLRPAHNAGIDTILSFTDYRGPGISKSAAWPVTTFVRGRAKWVA